jgi:hypothetical protein
MIIEQTLEHKNNFLFDSLLLYLQFKTGARLTKLLTIVVTLSLKTPILLKFKSSFKVFMNKA